MMRWRVPASHTRLWHHHRPHGTDGTLWESAPTMCWRATELPARSSTGGPDAWSQLSTGLVASTARVRVRPCLDVAASPMHADAMRTDAARRRGLVIRLADERDAPAVQAVYAPYVRDTAISFETEPPTRRETGRG